MGEVIQFRDFQNPKDLARMYSEETLEQQAVKIMAGLETEPYGFVFCADEKDPA